MINVQLNNGPLFSCQAYATCFDVHVDGQGMGKSLLFLLPCLGVSGQPSINCWADTAQGMDQDLALLLCGAQKTVH